MFLLDAPFLLTRLLSLFRRCAVDCHTRLQFKATFSFFFFFLAIFAVTSSVIPASTDNGDTTVHLITQRAGQESGLIPFFLVARYLSMHMFKSCFFFQMHLHSVNVTGCSCSAQKMSPAAG